MSEIFRNPNNDFELIFKLVTPANVYGDGVTGKAGELDSDTVLIAYHNATVWTTASFASGSPVEIGIGGIYHITILEAWFTARDENYPIIVSIVDNAGTKTWIDLVININGRLELEKIKVQNSNANVSSVEIHALDLDGTSGKPAIDIVSQLGGGPGINMNVDDHAGILINVNNGEGIDIAADNEALRITSWNEVAMLVEAFENAGVLIVSDTSNIGAITLSGGEGNGIYIVSGGEEGTEPTVRVKNSANGDGVSIEAEGTGNGVNIEAQGAGNGVKIEGTDGPAIEINASNNYAISITSAIRCLIDSVSPLIDLENTGGGGVVKIDNNGTGEDDSPAVKIINTNDENAVTIDAQGEGNALECKSTTGYDIKAKELTNILRSTDTVDGTDMVTLLSILKGSIIGKYALDAPDPGKITIFKNDNVTPLVIVTMSDTQRIRNLPV